MLACTSAPVETPSPGPTPFTGGTLRILIPADSSPLADSAGDPAAVDPQLRWPASYDAMEVARCCLARTLLSANGRAVDQGGSRLHPDAALSLPEISDDGLIWTFRLRPGLRYAPPLDEVEVTASDFIRGLSRFLSPAFQEEWPPYLLTDIVGATEYREGDATSIAGFESPDDHTLVVRLTAPSGDLAARLAQSSIIPIPPNLANLAAPLGVAQGHDDGYGRYFASSGPYMIEGSADLNFGLPPAEQIPLSGLVPGERLVLIPNPSWDPTTDSLRPARPGRIEIVVVPTVDQGIADVLDGRADLLVNIDAAPGALETVADALAADPSRGRLYVNESGTEVGLTLNLAQPPMDDLNVRKAINLAVDKAAIIEQIGGPFRNKVAHHVVPDSMLDNLLVDYRPYATLDDRGDIEAAMAEMAKSRYDTDADGVCDADACQQIDFRANEGVVGLAESIRADLAPLGLDLVINADPGAMFEAVLDPGQHAAMLVPHGWGRDYLAASNFLVGQYLTRDDPDGIPHPSLVGASSTQLAEWGYGNVQLPNVDARIEACVPLTGAAQFECWAALDQHLMENVVATVPYAVGLVPVLASRRVTGYAWDELAGAPAYDQISLAP